ncbi:MAG: hypothetical protein KDA55_11205, partial [Planctomycetales bacterium]|nr:hypothetical protein [Planctomycetales bacterium]
AGADVPWIYASQATGLNRFELPLIGKDEPAAAYTVKLHFAEPDDSVKSGARLFDVKLQGETVAQGIDVATEAGGAKRALTRTFSGVHVTGNLVVELPAKAGLSLLSAIEVERK